MSFTPIKMAPGDDEVVQGGEATAPNTPLLLPLVQPRLVRQGAMRHGGMGDPIVVSSEDEVEEELGRGGGRVTPPFTRPRVMAPCPVSLPRLPWAKKLRPVEYPSDDEGPAFITPAKRKSPPQTLQDHIDEQESKRSKHESVLPPSSSSAAAVAAASVLVNIRPVWRFRGSKVAGTVAHQAGKGMADQGLVREAIIHRLGKNCQQVLIATELHGNGERHYHFLGIATPGHRFDIVGNALPQLDNAVVNYKESAAPVGWFAYCTKELYTLWDTSKKNNAPVDINSLLERKPDSNMDHYVMFNREPVTGEMQLGDLSLMWAALSQGIFRAIADAETPRDALVACARILGGEGKALQQVANIVKAHGYFHLRSASAEDWATVGQEKFQVSDFDDRLSEILAITGEWITGALDTTRDRHPILLIVGPSMIGKTTLVRTMVPPRTAYCIGSWSTELWLNSSGIVVLDDLTPMFGSSGGVPQPGASAAPLKSWTQSGTWRYNVLYKGEVSLPTRRVCIISNTMPLWMTDPYWVQNTVVICLKDEEGPLWLNREHADYVKFVADRRLGISKMVRLQ